MDDFHQDGMIFGSDELKNDFDKAQQYINKMMAN
jgi:hypothetical protein